MSAMTFAESTLDMIDREASDIERCAEPVSLEEALALLDQAMVCLEQDEFGQPSVAIVEMLEAVATRLECERTGNDTGIFREIAPPASAPATPPAPGLATNRELANRIRLVRDKLNNHAR